MLTMIVPETPDYLEILNDVKSDGPYVADDGRILWGCGERYWNSAEEAATAVYKRACYNVNAWKELGETLSR